MRGPCRRCCALLGRHAARNPATDVECPLVEWVSGQQLGAPSSAGAAAGTLRPPAVALDALRRAHQHCTEALPVVDTKRGTEALERLRLAIDDLAALVEEQEEWEHASPDGEALLHTLSVEAAGPEDPPEWVRGKLFLGAEGLRFQSYSAPHFVVTATWPDVGRSNVQPISQDFSSTAIKFDVALQYGTGHTHTLRLLLAASDWNIFEDLIKQSGHLDFDVREEAGSVLDPELVGGTRSSNAEWQDNEQTLSVASAMEQSQTLLTDVNFGAGRGKSFYAALDRLVLPRDGEPLGEPVSRIKYDIAQDGVIFSVVLKTMDSNMSMADAAFRASCEIGVRSAIASVVGRGVTADHVTVVLSTGFVIVMAPSGITAEDLLSGLRSSTNVTANADTAEGEARLCISICGPRVVRGIAVALTRLVDVEFPFCQYFVDDHEVTDLQMDPWILSRREEGTLVRRYRYHAPTPLEISDIAECTTAVQTRVPTSLGATVMHHLTVTGDEVVFRRQVFSDDVPYSDCFHAQQTFRFIPEDGGVVIETFQRIDRVQDFPRELVSNGDDEIIEYLLRGAQDNGSELFDNALKAHLLQQPLAPTTTTAGCSLLGPTVRHFGLALACGPHGDDTRIHRVPFFAALEAFAKALAELHRSLPDSLCKNLAMLRRSKAPKEIEYGCWLQGEVDVHKRHRFAHYAAESAWMGNLWLGRILEFFVEMFALLRTGEETGACCSLAFKKTLHQHMNIVQRKGFGWAIASVPARAKLLQLLAGAANVEESAAVVVAVPADATYEAFA